MHTQTPWLANRAYLDWFLLQSEAGALQFLSQSAEMPSTFGQYLGAVGEPYDAEIRPTFLTGIHDLELLDAASEWLVRDGRIPLSLFFTAHPAPLCCVAKLYIEDSLRDLVPDPWRMQIGTYQLVNRLVGKDQSRYSKLLIVGVNSAAYCELPEAARLLQEAAKGFEERHGSAPDEVIVHLLQKREPLQAVEKTTRHTGELLLEVCQLFGRKLRFLNPDEFEASRGFDGCEILDLNQKLVCADSSLVHTALTKGARLPPPSAVSDNSYDRLIQLGLTYAFGIRAPDAVNHSTNRPTYSWMTGLAARSFPWTAWFRAPWPYVLVTSELTGTKSTLLRACESGGNRRVFRPETTRLGQVDLAQRTSKSIVIQGWALDVDFSSSANEVLAFVDSRALPCTFSRMNRPDVLRSLGSDVEGLGDALLRSGFRIEVPLSAIDESLSENVVSVLATLQSELVVHLADLVLTSGTSKIARLDEALGEVRRAEVQMSDEWIRFHGLERRFKLDKLTECGRVDSCEVVDGGGLSIQGWAADIHNERLAEAVLVVVPQGGAWIVPIRLLRPDVAKSHAPRFQLAGFRAVLREAANAVDTLRVFALFEDGRACELPRGVVQ